MGPKLPPTPPVMACAPKLGPGEKTSMDPPKAQVRPTAPWRRADAKTPMTPAPGLKREKPLGPPVAKPAKVAKTEQAVENEVREYMQKRGFGAATLTPDQLRLAAQAWHAYREKFFHAEGRWRPRDGHIDGGRFGESGGQHKLFNAKLRAAKAKGPAAHKAFMNEEGYAYYAKRNAAKQLAATAKANQEAKAKANLQEKASSSASSSASSGGPWFPI